MAKISSKVLVLLRSRRAASLSSSGPLDEDICHCRSGTPRSRPPFREGHASKVRQRLSCSLVQPGLDVARPNVKAGYRSSSMSVKKEGHSSNGGGRPAWFRAAAPTGTVLYAPTLKALALANFAVRTECGEFSTCSSGVTRRLRRTGGHAGLSPEGFDKRALQANADRLESRLRTSLV